MTTTADTPPQSTQDTPDGAQPPEDAPETPDGAQGAEVDDEVTRLRREAAERRVTAREATERADRLHRALLDRTIAAAAGPILADVTDLPPGDFLDDDDLPDPAKIEAAARALVEAKPHLAARRFAPIPAGPQGDDAPPPTTILGALRSV